MIDAAATAARPATGEALAAGRAAPGMSRAADIAPARAQLDRAARLLRALAYPGLPGKPRGAPPIRLRCAPRPAPAGWAVVRGAAVPIDRPQAVLIAAAAALAGLAAGAIALRLVA